MTHNILLVDDARTNVRILERILEGQGYSVFSAYSGEEALRLAEEHDFSVVLLDVRMPGMSGYEVARHLGEQAAHRRVPIIFITAKSDDEGEAIEGYSAGGVDYVLKPVKPAIVRRKVQIFCELQEKEKQIEAQNHQLEKQLAELRAVEEARMESEIRYRSLVSLSPQAILVEVAGKLVYYNASAVLMLGSIDEESMQERPFHTFVVEEDRKRVRAWLDTIERCGGRGEPIECGLILHDNESERGCRHVEIHACCVLYDDQSAVQMAVQDITDHKLLEDKLRRLSQLDGLTGVWNRRSFDQRLEEEWSRLARSGGEMSIIMVDLDKFKQYNDMYGHLGGDTCLQTVAKSMADACKRPADMVARYGGEEFVVLLPDTDAEGARHLAENLVSRIYQLQVPHEGNKTSGVVTISCGYATAAPNTDQRPVTLVQAADAALYEVKRKGGNGVAVGTMKGCTNVVS